MGLKKYIISSILLIVIIGGYVFSLDANEYTIKILDYELTLLIAVWAIVPTSILLVFTILHILFYGFRNFLETRAIEKDEENIINLIKDFLLENKSKQKFKTKVFSDLSSVLMQMNLSSVKDFKSENEELNTIVSVINKINEGEYISIKNMKFNPHGNVHKKNILNKINADIDFALEVVKKTNTYSKDDIKCAFTRILEEKSMTTIKKITPAMDLDKDMVLALFQKDKEEADFSIGLEEIKRYAKKSNFTKNDYIDLVKLYKDTFTPDEIIKMSEELSNDEDLALDAYLYILLEFEMLDEVRELLNACADDEYTAFKALIDLKDNGKHYSLDTINYKN